MARPASPESESNRSMPYDPALVQPMRDELSRIGVTELMTADAVNDFMGEASGTTLLVVNSVCGCAAGGARPAIALALQHENKPDRAGTVFAGQDLEATARARELFGQVPPSSPCFGLLKDGELVHFVPRHKIEGQDPRSIAFELVEAFDQHCGGS